MNTNAVFLGGNLTRDPDLRYTTSGVPVADFSIANNRKFKTKAGEQKEETAFIGCTVFGAIAESFAKYHRKGSQVFVQGRLSQDSWEDKQSGAKREKTKILVESWQFVGGKPHGGQGSPPQDAPAAAAKVVNLPNTATQDEDDVPF